ncbi:hypothetical protein BGZ65_002185 [Modicella reniformis]|uniref:Uncharacterized protein n=1 Tax=Modicella reniformis TaxID=1440133 RepID=A0A9P6SU00_9FUNG|nr:hypothetical protein BGZ65_002185 [Modicella reniformis]
MAQNKLALGGKDENIRKGAAKTTQKVWDQELDDVKQELKYEKKQPTKRKASWKDSTPRKRAVKGKGKAPANDEDSSDEDDDNGDDQPDDDDGNDPKKKLRVCTATFKQIIRSDLSVNDASTESWNLIGRNERKKEPGKEHVIFTNFVRAFDLTNKQAAKDDFIQLINSRHIRLKRRVKILKAFEISQEHHEVQFWADQDLQLHAEVTTKRVAIVVLDGGL